MTQTKINKIISAVSDIFGVAPEMMMRRDRTRTIAMSRFAAWRLMSEAGLTHQVIGDYFGMNQSNIAYGIKITRQWEEHMTICDRFHDAMLNEARRETDER